MNRRAILKQKRRAREKLFKQRRLKYWLTDLLVQCDAGGLPILEEWERMQPVGLEVAPR